MSGEINWGPEIAVEGKRPYFVSDDDMVCHTFGKPFGAGLPAAAWAFDGDGKYYLRADHPHYATSQPATDAIAAVRQHMMDDGK